MSDKKITWENQIQYYFTQMEVGCMRAHGLDLSSYKDVRNNANAILERVSKQPDEPLFMPAGRERWPQGQIDDFKTWIENGKSLN
ncbi:hypothetical protein [Candidatus Entotheonella palauensis]|uniref:hypothetical protein n=1 Tax=Candidatus Entotheonella palauensis TaxID=93172 RepID=UPI0015C472AE|nr:hypothetical protein [Candidatus Entotheonella palauensis]